MGIGWKLKRQGVRVEIFNAGSVQRRHANNACYDQDPSPRQEKRKKTREM